MKSFDPKEDILFQIRERKQYFGEPTQNYVYDKVVLCHRLNRLVSEMEILNMAYDGLDPAIRRQVYLHNPTDYNEVIRIAKRIESIQRQETFQKYSNRDD